MTADGMLSLTVSDIPPFARAERKRIKGLCPLGGFLKGGGDFFGSRVFCILQLTAKIGRARSCPFWNTKRQGDLEQAR